MAKGFILIPDEVADRTDLNAGHKLIMGILARLQGSKSWCYPSFEYLAKASGISRRQVVRLVNDLARREEIVRLRHKRGEPNTYSVPWATARAIRKSWAEKKAAREAV